MRSMFAKRMSFGSPLVADRSAQYAMLRRPEPSSAEPKKSRSRRSNGVGTFGPPKRDWGPRHAMPNEQMLPVWKEGATIVDVHVGLDAVALSDCAAMRSHVDSGPPSSDPSAEFNTG